MFNTTKLPISILTDSYKAGHFMMYPEAQEMVAYGEFRKPFDGMQDERIVFYGIRYIVETYLNYQWTIEDVKKAEIFYNTHNVAATKYPFPKDLFIKFIKENNGYFPITLEAMPEGSVVFPHTPVYQITAKGEYSRLVTFFETLLTQVWYTSNIATLSRLTRQKIDEAFEKSVDSEFDFLRSSRLHDFGFRGATSLESATLGGVAHLLSFEGSDTMSAAFYAQFHLNNGVPVASSIPATEHSVMTSWETEEKAVQNMVDNFGDGLFAAVADSYDYHKYLNTVIPKVAEQIKVKGGTIVIRPDSGDPVKCVLDGLRAAEKYFGCSINSKGYKVINNAAVIQGDGIDYNIICTILDEVLNAKYSAQNVAFGMGAGLLQKHNRDTMSFATKLSYIRYADGVARDVMKAPTTDSTKFSLPGKLQVIRRNGIAMAYPNPASWEDKLIIKNELQVVYNCGPVKNIWDASFEDTRERVDLEWANAPKSADSVSEQLKRKIREFTKGKKSLPSPYHDNEPDEYIPF